MGYIRKLLLPYNCAHRLKERTIEMSRYYKYDECISKTYYNCVPNTNSELQGDETCYRRYPSHDPSEPSALDLVN